MKVYVTVVLPTVKLLPGEWVWELVVVPLLSLAVGSIQKPIAVDPEVLRSMLFGQPLTTGGITSTIENQIYKRSKRYIFTKD